MFFALDIIKRYDFRFPMFYNCTYGKLVYNKEIKDLFVHCKIDRLISRYDEATQRMNQTPLYRIVSDKLCRKTHIDIANKVQINMYAIGLHEVGSSAVGHYSKLQIQDLSVLLNLAFNQPQYKGPSHKFSGPLGSHP